MSTAAPPPETDKPKGHGFQVSPDAYKRIQAIQAVTELKTPGEVIRHALRLYEWVAKVAAEGEAELEFAVLELDGTLVTKQPLENLL